MNTRQGRKDHCTKIIIIFIVSVFLSFEGKYLLIIITNRHTQTESNHCWICNNSNNNIELKLRFGVTHMSIDFWEYCIDIVDSNNISANVT